MSWDYIDPVDFAPKDMMPDGVLVVLTGIIHHGEFNYYVLPRHLLFLDAAKGDGAAMYDGLEGRFGIMTVDEAHEEEFFRAIEPHKRSLERLREELCACEDKYERASYATEVVIDFDCKHLTSYFCEPYYFEESIPEGWTSERGGISVPGDYFFVDDGPDGLPPESLDVDGPGRYYIPLDKRFWIDENGKSIFKMLYEKENNT